MMDGEGYMKVIHPGAEKLQEEEKLKARRGSMELIKSSKSFIVFAVTEEGVTSQAAIGSVVDTLMLLKSMDKVAKEIIETLTKEAITMLKEKINENVSDTE